MTDYCCVVGCSQARGEEAGVSCFRFPKRDQEQRELWIKAVQRKSTVAKNSFNSRGNFDSNF